MLWKKENFMRVVWILKKLCKRHAMCEQNMWEQNVRDVLNARKLCNSCAECEKIVQMIYWMQKNYTRSIECEKNSKRCAVCNKIM